MSISRVIELPDEAATLALGTRLAAVVGAGVITLEGELGAGKTCLVRGILRGLGYAGRVKSPTYTLVEPYSGLRLPITHWDLYRLASPDELEALGMREAAAGELRLVEWPERAAGRFGTHDLCVRLEYRGEGRRASLEAGSTTGARWLRELPD